MGSAMQEMRPGSFLKDGPQLSHGITILITSIVDSTDPFSFRYLCRWTLHRIVSAVPSQSSRSFMTEALYFIEIAHIIA